MAGSVTIELNHSSSVIIYAHTSLGSHNTTHDDNISYWEWKWYTQSHIIDMKAPLGSE